MKIKTQSINCFQPPVLNWSEFSHDEKINVFKREVIRYTNMPLSFKKLCDLIKNNFRNVIPKHEVFIRSARFFVVLICVRKKGLESIVDENNNPYFNEQV